jgi:hypothetical protein
MTDETLLTEQEKRYFNAVKLFMESKEDRENLGLVKMLNELTPAQARAMIVLHHIWLEDPPLFFSAYKLSMWISPIVDAWAHVKGIFLS